MMDMDTVWLVVIISQLCLFIYLVEDAGLVPQLIGAYVGWVHSYASAVIGSGGIWLIL
jgi:hypothetical protein